MVDLSIQGKQYPPTEPYLVAREKVRDFARAVGSNSPLHFNVNAAREAGYTDVIAPPTFAVTVQEATLAQLISDPEANVDFSRVVHGDQRFEYERPIVAGDMLTASLTVTSVKQLGAHSMVTASSEILDDTGNRVVTATSTLVVRGEES